MRMTGAGVDRSFHFRAKEPSVSDPLEAWIVADALHIQSQRRAGLLRIGSIDAIARSAPKLFQEMLEDAEFALDALEKHRAEKKLK